MFYDIVIIGRKISQNQDCIGTEQILYLSLEDTTVHIDEGEERKNILKGDILELRKEETIFEIVVFSNKGQLHFIHTKKIVLTAYTQLQENKIISLYEVLWAAKVKLDELTLTPTINQNQETSIPRLYYQAKVSEN